MKTAAVLLATVGLAVAGSAVASSRLTDVDYLQANRCRGLAESLNAGDPARLDALIKTEATTRVIEIYAEGQEERERARKDASYYDTKERLTAELNGPCTALLSGGGGGRATATSR